MTEITKQKTIEDAYKYFLRKNAANLPLIYNHIIYNTFDGHFYARVEGCIHSSDRLVCTREEFEAYAKEQEKKDKPVYTQEMADNGELPPVGMIASCCLIHLDKAPETTGEVKYISNEVVVIRDENSNEDICFYIKLSCFLPIDTRTDEEKLVDEMEDIITEHCSSNGTLRDLPRTFLEHYDITPK